MTDIWNEKPFSLDDLRVDEEGNPIKSEMAIWLEKVKELYDIYVKQYHNMTEHALEQQKVLETVKGYVIMEAENIKSDMDHKGMLKPILDHFLKEL